MKFLQEIRRRQTEFPPYYEAPAGAYKRYDQNVNLLGPHPVVQETFKVSDVHLYPHRDNRPLLEALAQAFGLSEDRYWVANGSDEVLDQVFRLFAEPGGRVVAPSPTYSMYPHLARLNRLAYVAVPTDEHFQTQTKTLLAKRPDLVLLCNPNNPTGTLLDPRIVGELLESFDGPIVVDEAYAEFAGVSVLPLVEHAPNLIVVRTLSKAYGLAGLRVGYGVAHADVAELVRRAKLPFSVNRASEALAIRALQDRGPVERGIAQLTRERERLTRGLVSLGFRVWPSHANFLLTQPPVPARELYDQLRDRGILARRYPHEPALEDHLRFTVGTAQDTDTLVRALEELLKNEAFGGRKRP